METTNQTTDPLLSPALPTVMALAYLGDAVHALYVRRRLVSLGISRSGDLNARALSFVTAPMQANLCRRIADRFTEAEAEIFRRAFNHKGLGHPKHASGADYRTATGFEAVLGALDYVGQKERLDELLALAHEGLFTP